MCIFLISFLFISSPKDFLIKGRKDIKENEDYVQKSGLELFIKFHLWIADPCVM